MKGIGAMHFVSIDVETANADMASICQIGIAKFRNGELVEEWVSLIDPQDYFDPMNISVHGIADTHVIGQPTFTEVFEKLRYYLTDTICVSHTHFDRASLQKAITKQRLELLQIHWLDSAKVARRTWSEVAKKGYGLSNLCERIGYKFKHHDALEDAKAAGYVLLAAIKESQINIEDWSSKLEQPIAPYRDTHGHSEKLEPNPEGKLAGEFVVFTGALEIPRQDAAKLAAEAGCCVLDNVTSETTLLIVGDQDISRLAGKAKSSKHIKAEKLIAKGHNIRILQESDFRSLLSL